MLHTAAVRLVDSVTESPALGHGCVLVTGSHGGASVVRYALEAQPALVVFNDAGVGLDGAGIAALPALDLHGIAACTVAHDSARIGEARSSWLTGVVSHANAAALSLGMRTGLGLRPQIEG